MVTYQEIVDRLLGGQGLLSAPEEGYDPSYGGLLSEGDRRTAFQGTLANVAQNIAKANEAGGGTGSILAAAAGGLAEGRDYYKQQALERARQSQQYNQTQQDRQAWQNIFSNANEPPPAGLTAAEAAMVGAAGPNSGVSSALLARDRSPSDRFGPPMQGPDGNWYQQNLITGQFEPMGRGGGRNGPLVQIGDLSGRAAQELSDNAWRQIQASQEAVDAQYNILHSYQTMENLAMAGQQGGWTPNVYNGLAASAQRLMEGAGIDVNLGAGTTEPITAISNQLALYARNPDSGGGLTGNTSNKDLQFLKDSIPRANMTREGFWTLLKVAKAKAEFAAKYNEAKQQALYDHAGRIPPSFYNEWRDKQFLTPELREEIKALAGMTAAEQEQGDSGEEVPIRTYQPGELPAGVSIE